MSGWGANPDPDSSWEGNNASTGWNSEPAPAAAHPELQANGVFETSAMSAALPSDNVGVSQPANTTSISTSADPSGDGPAGAWVKPEEYDYGEYATSGGQFDGNVAVYHWDGEEGDIGPEFPQLEAELFGPSERRELPQGIDFTK